MGGQKTTKGLYRAHGMMMLKAAKTHGEREEEFAILRTWYQRPTAAERCGYVSYKKG